MKQSCWSCKHCNNDYFSTGTMDCKKQDDMTEDEFKNYYGNNGGENGRYYEENYDNGDIVVKHENGYYGKLYGKNSMSVYWNNREVYHTSLRDVNTASELYDLLSDIPHMIEILFKE